MPGLWFCQGGAGGTGSTSAEDRAGGEEGQTWSETSGPLSPEAWLMAVDPQDSQEGPQLNLKSRSSGGH